MSTSLVDRILRRPRRAAPGGVRAAAVISDDAITVGAVTGGRVRSRRIPITDEESTDVAALIRARRWLDLSTADGATIECALVSRDLNIFPLTLVGEAADAPDAAIVAQARNRMPYSLSEAIVDYHELPTSVQRPGDQGVNVLVFTAHRPRVDLVLDRLTRAGWSPSRLLTPGNALARVAGAAQRHLVLASTPTAISVAVVEEETVLMERIVHWGERRLMEQVSARLDLSSAVASRLILGDVGVADLVATTRVVREILAPAYHELVREAIACLGYCTSTLQAHHTTDTWVVGSIARAPGFAAVLRHGTGSDVEMNPLSAYGTPAGVGELVLPQLIATEEAPL